MPPNRLPGNFEASSEITSGSTDVSSALSEDCSSSFEASEAACFLGLRLRVFLRSLGALSTS